jgi:AcrR family transcriptional regulator
MGSTGAADAPDATDAAFALASHGELRRGQLVRVAAHVIENEGLDALRMPRVAELAGCARSLVYRYFPRREDLCLAVVSEFYERLEQRQGPAAQRAGMRGLARGDEARPLLEAIWDVVTEIGAGGLVLRASPSLAAELKEHLEGESARFEASWIAPLREAGLGPLEAALVVRSAMGLLAELLARHRAGEVTREAAIDVGHRALAALVAGLRAGRAGEGRS